MHDSPGFAHSGLTPHTPSVPRRSSKGKHDSPAAVQSLPAQQNLRQTPSVQREPLAHPGPERVHRAPTSEDPGTTGAQARVSSASASEKSQRSEDEHPSPTTGLQTARPRPKQEGGGGAAGGRGAALPASLAPASTGGGVVSTAATGSVDEQAVAQADAVATSTEPQPKERR